MLNRKRLELALERTQPTDWPRFEQFASAFLTSEFPSLRTVASPNGDEGRDAVLFSPEGEDELVLQYSVTDKWKKKIQDTVTKIRKNLTNTRHLIYVTNQKIGAAADDLKRQIRREHSIALDIRDESFFLDRFEGSPHQEAVAANYARDIVDPYLESREVIDKKAQALTPGESRAALVFLELQWQDDSRDKGLTKTAFDGLVRMALRNTNSEKRISRTKVHEIICSVMSVRNRDAVIAETDKSLERLKKRYVRHHVQGDEYCLTYEESERLKGRLAELEIQDGQMREEMLRILTAVLPEDESKDDDWLSKWLDVCRTSLEKYLFQRGELFVTALDSGQLSRLGFESIREIVEHDLKAKSFTKRDEAIGARLATVVERVLTSSNTAISRYLRNLADTYTLMAFLREAPDVQNAVRKMFSFGEIWLDTSILLPLIAEDLLPEERWQFRRMINAAREAGLRFKVTRGVVEEVERHINRCITCAGWHGEWRGSYPYLFAFYISSGSSQVGFSSWIAKFVGEARPEDDIQEYLKEFFDISTEEISSGANQIDQELRAAVKETWISIHTERRGRAGQDIDPLLTIRLAEHDAENYIGVIARRRQEGVAALGFTSWWLTLDHMAFEVSKRLVTQLSRKSPPSPVMSADFLTNYLAFGPLREKVAKTAPQGLPVAVDPSLVEYLSPELVQLAAKVREDSMGQEEHVIRRKVRDALDSAKRRTGDITKKGLGTSIVDAA